jgi:putative ABC transport system ATP-binding protein
MDVIEVRRLTKSYGDGPLAVHALRGVDLSVRKGEFLAIMGPSGSGKSTLLHLLGGIESPTSGEILLEGVPLSAMGDDARTLLRRRRIGLVFQSFNLLPAFTAEENVGIPLLLDGVGRAELQRRAAEMLELVRMAHRRGHVPGALSGGEQQRLAIARALVIRPAILLADEPTGNLDSASGAQVTTLLRQLVDDRQQTVIMVTHDLAVAQRADRIVRLRDGQIEEPRPQAEPAEAAAGKAVS